VTNPRQLLHELESYVQDEVGARQRMIDIVARQEAAVKDGRAVDLEQATRDLEHELTGQVERARRRERIFAGFAAAWQVAPAVLSLSSIAERIGPGTDRLLALRAELRDATAALAKRNRRLAALTALYRRVLGDVIETIVRGENSAPLENTGTLVNARG
jgi:hypothetical protein